MHVWHIVNYDTDEPSKRYEEDFQSWCEDLANLVGDKNIKEYQRFESSLRPFKLVTPLGKAAHHFILLVAEDKDSPNVTYISLEKDQNGFFAGVSTDCEKLIRFCNKCERAGNVYPQKRAGKVYPMDNNLVYLEKPYVTLEQFLQSIESVDPSYRLINDNCQHLVVATFSVLSKEHFRTFNLPPKIITCSKNQMVYRKYAERFLNEYDKKYGQNVLNNKLYSPMEEVQIFGPPGSGKTEMALYIVENIKDRDAIYININLPLLGMTNTVKRDFNGNVRNYVSNRILDVLYTPLQARPLITPYKELKELLRRRTEQLFIALDGIDNIIKNHPVDFRRMIYILGSKYVHILIVASEKLFPTPSSTIYECKGFSEDACKLIIKKQHVIKEGDKKSFANVIFEDPSNTDNHKKKVIRYFSPEVFNHRLADYQKNKKEQEHEQKGSKYNHYSSVTPEGIIKTKYDGDLNETEKVCLLIIAMICLGQTFFTVKDVMDFIDAMIASKINKNIAEVLLMEHPDFKNISNLELGRLIHDLVDRILVKLDEMAIIHEKFDEEISQKIYVIRSSVCQFLLEYGKEEYIAELRLNYVYCSFSKYLDKDWVKNTDKSTYIKRKCEAERAISMIMLGNVENVENETIVDRLKLRDGEFLTILTIIDDVTTLLANLNALLWYPNYYLVYYFTNHINNLSEKDYTTSEDLPCCRDLPKQKTNDFSSEYSRYIRINELIWKVIHPRLLYILHNEGHHKSYNGLPRNPTELRDVFQKESTRNLIKEYRLTLPEYSLLYKKCKECSSAGKECTCELGVRSEMFDITLICNLMPMVLKDKNDPKQNELRSYVQDVRKIRNKLAHLTPKNLEEESQDQWRKRWNDYVDKAYGKDKNIFEDYQKGKLFVGKLSQVSNILEEISYEEEDNVSGVIKYVVMDPCENNLDKYITSNPDLSRRQKVICQLIDFIENNDIVLCNLNPSTISISNDRILLNTTKSMKQNYNNQQWVHRDSLAINKQDNIFTLLMILFYIQFGVHPFGCNGMNSQNSEETSMNVPRRGGDGYDGESFRTLFRNWKTINISDIRSKICRNDVTMEDGSTIVATGS